jgi:hypothetical protein
MFLEFFGWSGASEVSSTINHYILCSGYRGHAYVWLNSRRHFWVQKQPFSRVCYMYVKAKK